MTRLDEIRELYQFNAWANRKMFDATGALSDEELATDMKSSFPSIRDTLVHIVGAEWVWFARWKGSSPSALPSGKANLNHEQIVQWWNEIDQERDEFLASLPPNGIDTTVEYTNFAGTRLAFPLWQQLRHVVNHSSYHRGQVVTMLRQLGRPGVQTDMVLMYQERAIQKTV